jgi:formylglycine-generating enzyme required for sulfatase activity
VGADVAVGAGKVITWNAGTDWLGNYSSTMRFEVTAEDGVDPVPADMALIPAGSFTMGDSLDNITNAPPVTVSVGAFYMGKYEVTKALWDEVRTWGLANGYTDLAAGAGKDTNHPVQSISWFDMVKWCNARSEKEGLTPVYTVSSAVMKTGTTGPVANWSANGYRLPTAAEWEKAARGGVSGKRFPWGTDTISHSRANYYASSSYSYDSSGSVNNFHPTYATGSYPYTSPVGAFAANGYGLYDMAGNVWEWCWDWYGGTYANGATDPRGAASGTSRVGRGGSWNFSANYCRVASRDNGSYPTGSGFDVGFRVARSSVPEEFVLVEAGALPADSWAGAQSVEAFFMGKTEVTWAEFQAVRIWAAANGYDIGNVGAVTGPNHPVNSVGWYQALKWCNARSEKEGLNPVYKVGSAVYRTGDSVPSIDGTANGYRLPSEKEWEFAARGGVKTNGYEYSGSNDINEVAWYSSNSGDGTKDVATKQANELGLSDMIGNVWEWCFDDWDGSGCATTIIMPH